MIVIIAAVLLTVLAVFFLGCLAGSKQDLIVEIVISKAWQNRLSKIDLLEKCRDYIHKNEKYHIYSEKKIEKKKKADKKQIEAYAKKEEAYLSGKEIGMIDLLPLVGYRFCALIGLDAESSMLRELMMSCEQSGYIELERGQETNGKKNSMIYSYYIFSSVVSYLYVGAMLGSFVFLLMKLTGKETGISLVAGAVVLAAMAVAGYLPLDALKNKAAVRKEEIDRELPNVISKLVLLLLSGMNISRAMEQVSVSGEGLIYQEFATVVKESSQSVSLEGALTRLQGRCSNKYIDKLVTIISKSFSSGNANLSDDLKNLNDECWLEKKHSSRRMADKVQTKLFVPTMIMFVGVLVVIIIPVMSGFNLGI